MSNKNGDMNFSPDEIKSKMMAQELGMLVTKHGKGMQAGEVCSVLLGAVFGIMQQAGMKNEEIAIEIRNALVAAEILPSLVK